MKEPSWISRVEVEALHHGVIEVGGGSHGLRDAALLESALGRPQNQHAYGETDIWVYPNKGTRSPTGLCLISDAHDCLSAGFKMACDG